ncbi:alpha/beta fold hydrolase [Massilia arenosa]|uniref:Proline iminopeptidase n=1 Tax=Zemynaea arenosa TaxID=2561931 RepID=A0A4Y9SCZ9_9BURK|nr:alpha/beta fold hydrolase [Massilia arenosa]TFW20483.1 alpha/beta fold hydrolase [Massilia arenosa]
MKPLFAALACSAALAAHAQDLPASFACPAGGAPVHEAGYVPIGGLPQWVTIDGADCRKPIVLVVHGGPGNANSPFASALFGPWYGEFTVVQWDQRGAGMTFVKNPPKESDRLSIPQLTQDGIDVATFATKRLGQPKAILMGASWGSVLAVHMAIAKPGLFSAYIGTAQLVSRAADGKAMYEMALARATALGDQKGLEVVRQYGAPPWTNPRAFGALRRVTRQYEKAATVPPPAGWWQLGEHYKAHEAAFEAADDWSYLQAVGMHGDGILEPVDLPKQLGTRFAIPVYLIQGTEDFVTPQSVTISYFNAITAPHKELHILARTGHDPNPPMVQQQYELLKRIAAGR